MRVQKKHKAFAYRVPIGDYNYLQCVAVADHCCTKVQSSKSYMFSASVLSKHKVGSSWHQIKKHR